MTYMPFGSFTHRSAAHRAQKELPWPTKIVKALRIVRLQDGTREPRKCYALIRTGG